MHKRVLPALGILAAGGVGIWFILSQTKKAEAKSGTVRVGDAPAGAPGSGTKVSTKGGLGGAVELIADNTKKIPGVGGLIGTFIGGIGKIFGGPDESNLPDNKTWSNYINTAGPGLDRYRQYRALRAPDGDVLSDGEAYVLAVSDFFTGDKYKNQRAARKHAVDIATKMGAI